MWYTINATAVKKPVNSVDAIASCVESFIVISLIGLHIYYLTSIVLTLYIRVDQLGAI